MSDRGQGIRLFSTQEELQDIFEGWEAEMSDSEEENEDDDALPTTEEKAQKREGDYIVTSHLRHFIAQPYIHPPLLLASNPRKFHIRTYVLAYGALKVYVYNDMLALFASAPYEPPWVSTSTTNHNLNPHLTNTCFQDTSSPSSSSSNTNPVHLLSTLPLSPSLHASIQAQIGALTGDVFEAAARGMMVHFQTLPNAFEVFGLDFLVDERERVWLLEVNAFPDFGQTGTGLRGVVAGLWEEVVRVAVGGFFGVAGEGEKGEKGEKGVDVGGEEGRGKLVCVRDLDLGRK